MAISREFFLFYFSMRVDFRQCSEFSGEGSISYFLK